MRSTRGFTLLELLVAGTLASVVVLGGFVALSGMQRAASRQARATELVSQGRFATEMISKDVRSAGDSIELLPQHCMEGMQAPGSPFRCAAILDPHPWRITLARNSWRPGADGVRDTMDDLPPQLAFDLEGNNVVTYQFVPHGAPREFGAGHRGVLGHLERIVNPFLFAGEPREVTVLLDNVLLDNRMRTNPADPTESDPRYHYSMFMYQLLRVAPEQHVGDSVYTQRTTRFTSFILPPARFFDPLAGYATYQDAAPAAPWLPNYGGGSVVGLHRTAAASATVFSASASFDDDMRYVLDFNRIRAVRIAFKIVEPHEDPDYLEGVDLDPDVAGTAHVHPFEATAELKVYSALLN